MINKDVYLKDLLYIEYDGRAISNEYKTSDVNSTILTFDNNFHLPLVNNINIIIHGSKMVGVSFLDMRGYYKDKFVVFEKCEIVNINIYSNFIRYFINFENMNDYLNLHKQRILKINKMINENSNVVYADCW